MAIYELNEVELDTVSAGTYRLSRNVVAKQKIVNVQVAAAASNKGDAAAVNQAQNSNNASADNISA